MKSRFSEKKQIFDIGLTALCCIVSTLIMLYGIMHFGLSEAWPELVLNVFYIACLVLMGLYFFEQIENQKFNYWCTVCIGITVLLRDILFPPPIAEYSYPLHLICLFLSVALLVMLTYFYARKDWKQYSKRNLWLLFIIDSLIAGLYHYIIVVNPVTEYTDYLLTEIWIRPTIIYALVACFISEKKE